MLNHICKSIWQGQINQTIIWGDTSRWHDPAKEEWNLQGPTKCIWNKDNIWIVGYNVNCRDHDKMLKWVMQICQLDNSNVRKMKCSFQCTSVLFFGEILFRDRVQQDPRKPHALTEMLVSINKKKYHRY